MSATAWVLATVGVLAGFAVGSFTCVVIDRLPVALDEPNEFGETWDTRRWREVLGGVSRCSSCGEPVQRRDGVPVVSWMLLRGRCRMCAAPIPAYHPWVELAVPAIGLVMVWTVGWGWPVIPVLALVPVGVAVAVIDLRTLMVPTRLVWPGLAVVVLCSVVAALATGESARLAAAALGALTLAAPLGLLWWFIPRGMGFGDVRLAVLLGWSVGFSSGTDPELGAVLAVICLGVASVAGLVLGLVVLGVRGRKARVPFGPALVVSALTCIALAGPILEPFRL